MDQPHPTSQQSNLTFDRDQFLDALPIPHGLQAGGPNHLLWLWLLAGMAALVVLAVAGAVWFSSRPARHGAGRVKVWPG